MKRPRETPSGDVASDDLSASDSERADETPGDTGHTDGPTASRDHPNITLGPTLRSSGLGRLKQCFLCSHTDAKLAEGSIFAEEFGPVERVTRLWRENVDSMDADLLANECHALLMQLVSAYAPLTSETGLGDDDNDGVTGAAAAFGGITADDIKHHYTVCMTTRDARLTALKASFRHVAQLESACAHSMYTACKKTGRPRPDPAMSALLLKANAALLKTNQLIGACEGKHP
jgi:hypothetical protein